MQASMFNLRVPLPERDEVFLMNTLTDAQLVVSSDVASLLDRPEFLNGGADGNPPRRRARCPSSGRTASSSRIGSPIAGGWTTT